MLYYGKCLKCPPIQANPSKFSPFFRSLFPRTTLPTKENTAYFRSTNRSTNRVKSPASPRLSLAFVQELCYTPRQGNPIKPVLFCAIGSRTISSAGMSIRLTCGRSQVQVLYRPPSEWSPLFEHFYRKAGFFMPTKPWEVKAFFLSPSYEWRWKLSKCETNIFTQSRYLNTVLR